MAALAAGIMYPEEPLPEDQHPIQTFALDAADEAFHDAIQMRGHRKRPDGLDPGGLQDLPEFLCEQRVSTQSVSLCGVANSVLPETIPMGWPKKLIALWRIQRTGNPKKPLMLCGRQ